MPDWVTQAVDTYSRRLSEFCSLRLIEVPLSKRGKGQGDISRIMEKEAALILRQIPDNAHCIVLDAQGKHFDSVALSQRVEQLHIHHSQWTFVIGGPEGHSPSLLARADERWSLSKLTFAHPLARIILYESLYRSFCIMHHRPYHK